ncbi:hypothetical protein ACROYT_G024507 [Oculina patagonica]
MAAESVQKEQKKTPRKSWTQSDIYRLIDLYEERTCLWDVFSNDYHNREVTGKAKSEMESILGLEWKEIYAQINSLRQVLGQNIKKVNTVKSGQSTDELYTPTWAFWNALQFLVPVMNAKPSKDTLKSSVETVPSDSNDLQEPSAKLPTKRKLQRGISDQQQLLMNECIRVLKQPDQPDQDTSFGLYVAKKLQGFDRRTRMIAEKKISDILYDLELAELEQISAGDGFNFTGHPAVSNITPPHLNMGTSGLTTLYPWPQQHRHEC